MRVREIVGVYEGAPKPPKPPEGGGVKPLTPKQSRAKAEKQAKAQDAVHDAQSASAVKVNTARRKLADL